MENFDFAEKHNPKSLLVDCFKHLKQVKNGLYICWLWQIKSGRLNMHIHVCCGINQTDVIQVCGKSETGNFLHEISWIFHFPQKPHHLALPQDLKDNAQRRWIWWQFYDQCGQNPSVFGFPTDADSKKSSAKSILIRTSSEKRHFTVVLTVTANEDTLLPIVIFKGNRTWIWTDLNMNISSGWIVTVQGIGWMDKLNPSVTG